MQRRPGREVPVPAVIPVDGCETWRAQSERMGLVFLLLLAVLLEEDALLSFRDGWDVR